MIDRLEDLPPEAQLLLLNLQDAYVEACRKLDGPVTSEYLAKMLTAAAPAALSQTFRDRARLEYDPNACRLDVYFEGPDAVEISSK